MLGKTWSVRKGCLAVVLETFLHRAKEGRVAVKVTTLVLWIERDWKRGTMSPGQTRQKSLL
jgi:hypothetical protein